MSAITVNDYDFRVEKDATGWSKEKLKELLLGLVVEDETGEGLGHLCFLLCREGPEGTWLCHDNKVKKQDFMSGQMWRFAWSSEYVTKVIWIIRWSENFDKRKWKLQGTLKYCRFFHTGRLRSEPLPSCYGDYEEVLGSEAFLQSPFLLGRSGKVLNGFRKVNV